MQKRWVQTEQSDPGAVLSLKESLNVKEIVAELLVRRGIKTFDEAKAFFRPELSDLHDPFLMKDMHRAVERIKTAINGREKILIYGDYDVDGTTAVALVYGFFSKLHPLIDYYIPDRYKEGYGISTQGIDFAVSNGYTLIVALDCGIKSTDKVQYATKHGVDFIICDHHTPADHIPAACAVLDPKQSDCNYPYKELSGCGIGFKLIQAFQQLLELPDQDLSCYLDLVAVSIASDIVPVTGENRILAWHGLKKLNSGACKGLAALLNVAGAKGEMTLTDVVFTIGPRINAAGRIDDGKHAVRLLIADTDDIAFERGQIIDGKNTLRREHDLSITNQALAMIDADPTLIAKKTTVLYDQDWHKGVIGIVASRLTEKYYRPTVVMTHSNGVAAGSARSVTGYDLYEALSECEDLLEQFGGHKYAAGLTIRVENIPAFQARFENVVSRTISDELLVQSIQIETEIGLNDIDGKLCRILKQFEPFGPENMAPVFVSRNVYTYGMPGLVGDRHLRLCVRQGDSAYFNCIGFGLAELLPLVNCGTPFDICYTIEENTWKEKKSLQLNIKGIRPAAL